MPLWGNKDSKTATGTVTITNGVVTGNGTSFTTEAKVNDYIVVNSTKYRITGITNTIHCTVTGAVLGQAAANVAAGNTYSLQEAPIYVTTSEVGQNVNNVFGVDTTEVGVTAGVAHSGWVRRTVGTGNRSGRVHHEVLVAGSSITGDAADDTEYPDS